MLFICSVISNSLQSHGRQHARFLCPSPFPGVFSNSCPLSWWCHPNLILCHPLLLPSVFPSIRVFSNESALCLKWPKYWIFSFSLSNEYSGLISLRMNWFDLLALPGTLKSLLQHHSLKASILHHSAFFMVQFLLLYTTTGKTIALIIWTFVGKSPYSQSYGFSSSHVWMWYLDHKEGWVMKNWCFWMVVLEETLENPLECKEIKPVSCKGNYPWIFIEKTNAEAKAPILWPPDVKSWLWNKPWCWER